MPRFGCLSLKPVRSLNVFCKFPSSHSLVLSDCIAFYLLPQSSLPLFPTQMVAVRFEVITNVSLELVLLQRQSGLGGRAWVLQDDTVLTIFLYRTESVKPHFSQLCNEDNKHQFFTGMHSVNLWREKASTIMFTFLMLSFFFYTQICPVYLLAPHSVRKAFSKPSVHCN